LIVRNEDVEVGGSSYGKTSDEGSRKAQKGLQTLVWLVRTRTI